MSKYKLTQRNLKVGTRYISTNENDSKAEFCVLILPVHFINRPTSIADET